MKYLGFKTSLVFLIGYACTEAPYGEETDPETYSPTETILSNEPVGTLPLEVRMEAFMITGVSTMIMDELVSEDQTQLQLLIFEAGQTAGKAAAESQVEIRKVLCDSSERNKSALEKARALTAINESAAQMKRRNFISNLDRMTESGRLTVLTFINEKLSSGIGYQPVDFVSMAKENPDSFSKSSSYCRR